MHVFFQGYKKVRKPRHIKKLWDRSSFSDLEVIEGVRGRKKPVNCRGLRMGEVQCGQQMNSILRKCGQNINQISRTCIYVYKGEGADDKAAETLLHGLHCYLDPMAYSLGFITPESIREGSWKNHTALLALGGGYDLGFINALGNDGIKHIKDYVTSNGGAYLGICAGAYFACDHIEFDKGGPLEVVGERQFKFFPGCCRGPSYPGFDYESNRGAVASKVLYRSSSKETIMQLYLYFNGGGTFIPPCQSFPPLKNGFISDSHSTIKPEEARIDHCHKIYSVKDIVALPDRVGLAQNHLNLHNSCEAQELKEFGQSHEHRDISDSSVNHVQENHESHGNISRSGSYICCDEIHKLRENPENNHNKIMEEKDVRHVQVAHESAQHNSTKLDLDSFRELMTRDYEILGRDYEILGRDYEILGRYAELEQQPACIVKCVAGKGIALLSSVHFEYRYCDLNPEDKYLVDIISKLKESETQRQAIFLSLLKNLSLRTIKN